jgi:hypothetical protein
MTGKKAILIIALILPIGVFMFLKFFGRNQFEVQPLFQERSDVIDCAGEYQFPYVIPDSISHQWKIKEYELTVVPFVHGDSSDRETSAHLRRIEEEFSGYSIQIKPMGENDTLANKIRSCVLLMPESTSVVLVDRAGSIRGQYDGSSLDEMDRLIVEMKIILKKY